MPDRVKARGLPTRALALVVPVVAVVAVAVAVAVTLAVTHDDTGTGAPAADRGGAPGTGVTIENFEFAPDDLRVAVGDEVTVTNADGATHTLTADDGTFDTGHLDGGASSTITIDVPGRHEYFCDIHDYMTGVIEAR